jgi:hypothetical protein
VGITSCGTTVSFRCEAHPLIRDHNLDVVCLPVGTSVALQIVRVFFTLRMLSVLLLMFRKFSLPVEQVVPSVHVDDPSGCSDSFWYGADFDGNAPGRLKRRKVGGPELKTQGPAQFSRGALVLRDLLRFQVEGANDDVMTVVLVVLHTRVGSPHFSLVHVHPQGCEAPYVFVDSNLTPGILACRTLPELQSLMDEMSLFPATVLLKRNVALSKKMSHKKAAVSAASDPPEPSVPGDILPFAPHVVACFKPKVLSISKFSFIPLCSRLPLLILLVLQQPDLSLLPLLHSTFAPFAGPSLQTAQAPVPVAAYGCTSDYFSPQESSVVFEG